MLFEIEPGDRVEEAISGVEGEIINIDLFNDQVEVKFDDGERFEYSIGDFRKSFKMVDY